MNLPLFLNKIDALTAKLSREGLEGIIAASIWKLIAGNLTAYLETYMEKNVGNCNKQLMQKRIFDKMFVEVG